MKHFKIIILVIVGLLLSGCSSTKTCVIERDQSDRGYKQTTKYVISIKNNYVYKVQQIDTIKSKQKSIINFYNDEYNNLYKKYNKTYKGYTFNVKVNGDKVIADCTVDYNKFNRKKYINDNLGLKKYVNKNYYFTKKGIIEMYKNLGATCK